MRMRGFSVCGDCLQGQHCLGCLHRLYRFTGVDDLRDDVATLNAKVDAMMMSMMQLKR